MHSETFIIAFHILKKFVILSLFQQNILQVCAHILMLHLILIFIVMSYYEFRK